MDKNPHASAGDMGSTPGLGRSHMPWSNQAHAPQLLQPCTEPVLHERSRHMRSRCSTTRGAGAARPERSPCSTTREEPPLTTTRESLCRAAETQLNQKDKKVSFTKQNKAGELLWIKGDLRDMITNCTLILHWILD